ncbi:MAG: DUF4397 domain-containing protein [Ferruginibacter sp.]|nr:DUF4397 domain-containing protein [Cytophagales bacterium]
MKNFISRSGRVRTYVLAVLLASGLALPGCKNDDTPPEPVGNAGVMFVHASTDAPAMDIYVGSVRQPSPLASLSNTDYVSVEAGSKNLELTEATKLNPSYAKVNQDFRKNAYYSVFAFNRATAVQSLVVVDSLNKTATGKAFVRLIHLAPDAPDVLVSLADANGTVMQAVIPVTKYKGYSTFREIAAGSTALAVQKADLSTVLVIPSQSFGANRFYTLIAQGFVNGQGNEALTVRVIENIKGQ